MTMSILQSFPQRLHFVLDHCEQQGRTDIISWENNGTAFRVNNLEEFERELLPRCFNTNNYNTFTRGLHSYGFTCVRAGRQTGIYSHPNFIRNDPVGICLMKRKSRKKAPKASGVGSPGSRPYGPPSMPNINSAGPVIGSVAATGFGQEYYVIASRLADWSTSLSAPNPFGSELSDIFDCEGFTSSLATRPNPNESASPHLSTNQTCVAVLSKSKVDANYERIEPRPFRPFPL